MNAFNVGEQSIVAYRNYLRDGYIVLWTIIYIGSIDSIIGRGAILLGSIEVG